MSSLFPTPPSVSDLGGSLPLSSVHKVLVSWFRSSPCVGGSEVSPEAHKQLYGIAFMNSFLSVTSLAFSGSLGLLFSGIWPKSWGTSCPTLLNTFAFGLTSVPNPQKDREKKSNGWPCILGVLALPTGEEGSPSLRDLALSSCLTGHHSGIT